MINVSIVLYEHELKEIEQLVETINSSSIIDQFYIIDNSKYENKDIKNLNVNYIHNHSNTGYGRAHNIAINKSLQNHIRYHLVVNPDIELQNSNQLENILAYMEQHKDVGLLMPKVIYPNGEIQYLCRLLPRPIDLFFRRFLPKSWNYKNNNKRDLRFTNYNKIMEVPFLSGAFMFLRTDAIREVGAFDDRFFMYGEDIDLSRRIHQKYKTIFYPYETVVHHHAQASYKSVKMLAIHSWNIVKYFNKWGWVFDKERDKINSVTLEKLLPLKP